ncbi:MAG: GNAT family N-acetyltransferase, partial [Candidatus Delongbacteria bacterium]|nr:GNAT family N-acetyltransferase [Candidatus Delongbacteria bacterium]
IENGMKQWIPDQVYSDENEAREVLEFLISCYEKPDPKRRPFVTGIALRDTGELIGHAGLSPLNGEVEIGYAVEEKHQGKGYATEAVRALSKYGITHFGLKSITGVVDKNNTGSKRVLEKAGYGFIKEEVRSAFGRSGLCRIFIFHT